MISILVHDENYDDDENLKPKKIKLKKPQKPKPVEIINNPNVLGFANSSSSEEESDEESEITNNSTVDIKESIETDVKISGMNISHKNRNFSQIDSKILKLFQIKKKS